MCLRLIKCFLKNACKLKTYQLQNNIICVSLIWVLRSKNRAIDPLEWPKGCEHLAYHHWINFTLKKAGSWITLPFHQKDLQRAMNSSKSDLLITSSHTLPISSAMFLVLQVTTVLWLMSLLSRSSSAYELQDTIHTLKDENFHLQNRLENLTQALRDLKHLLIEHSKRKIQVISLLHRIWEHFQNGSSVSFTFTQFLQRNFCTLGENGPNMVRSPHEVWHYETDHTLV